MIRIPLRTVNPLNQREHHHARARRVREERRITAWALIASAEQKQLPVNVILTRESSREMDTDGLAASFKGVRDQVAEWLGVDDADPRIAWVYAQRKLKSRGNYAVTIEFQVRGSESP